MKYDLQVRDFQKQITTDYKDKGLSNFRVYIYNDDYIKLDAITIDKAFQKKGTGSEILAKLVAFADKLNLGIVLTTAVKDKNWGTTSASRLITFYKRFGFVENKGRNKDYSVTGNMIRFPKRPIMSKPEEEPKVDDTDNKSQKDSDLDTLLQSYSDLVYNTFKDIESEAKDDNSKQFITNMYTKMKAPILNGMDLNKLLKFKDREEHKDILTKYIKQMIVYIEAHLNNFINNSDKYIKAVKAIKI